MSVLEYLKEQVYWGTVAGGVLPFCISTGRFLIALRSDIVMEPNTYGVWGGKIDFEDGESEDNIEEVVKREFREESGYNGNINLIPSHIYKDNKFKYYNFIGLIDKEFKPKLNWETEEYEWVTLNELYELEPKHFGLEELLRVKKSQIGQIVSRYVV